MWPSNQSCTYLTPLTSEEAEIALVFRITIKFSSFVNWMKKRPRNKITAKHTKRIYHVIVDLHRSQDYLTMFLGTIRPFFHLI